MASSFFYLKDSGLDPGIWRLFSLLGAGCDCGEGAGRTTGAILGSDVSFSFCES